MLINTPYSILTTYTNYTKPKELSPKTTLVWVTRESVDRVVSRLIRSKGFLDYIEETNQKILSNPSKFEDMVEKYK